MTRRPSLTPSSSTPTLWHLPVNPAEVEHAAAAAAAEKVATAKAAAITKWSSMVGEETSSHHENDRDATAEVQHVALAFAEKWPPPPTETAVEVGWENTSAMC